jgi:peptidyl-prolyl cis-trans isomerase D
VHRAARIYGPAMLDAIRQNKQSVLTYLIFIAIIVVFGVNFGPGSSGCQGLAGSPTAAKVDGDIIRQQEFAIIFNRQLETMRKNAQAGNFELTTEMIERMGLRRQVLDKLIDKKLLAREAARRGLEISDDELVAYIAKIFGQEDLDPTSYRRAVEMNFQTSVTRFEQDLRDELRAEKLQDVITEGVSVSDAELKADYLRERDRAMVQVVRFDAKPDATEPKAAAVDALIKNEEKVLEARYQMDRFKFSTPEQRRAVQIVKKVARDASPSEVEKAKSALSELKAQIEGGADFASLAKRHSDDPQSRDKGGDMGFIKRGMLGKDVEQAVFGLEVGTLTFEPVRSPLGLHLIRLEEIKPPATRELAEVQRELAASILKERAAEDGAKKKADVLLAELSRGKDLAKLTLSEEESREIKDKAKLDKPVRLETPWIAKHEQMLPRIGPSPELHAEIFALTKEAPIAKRVHKVGRSYYVVVLKERETPDLAKFDSEKTELRQSAIWEKRSKVLQDWLEHLRANATIELNPDVVGAAKEPTDAG